MAVIYGDIYTNPPKSAVPGARYDYRIKAITAAQLVNTNIFALGVLPAYHRLLDLILELADFDSGANITINVGLCNWYYNRVEPSASAPGWNKYNGIVGVPIQVGSSGGATTPGEVDGGGGTSAALATGCLIISATTIGQTGGRAGVTSSLTPMVTLGVSSIDRIVGVQLGVDPAGAQAGNLALAYLIDAA